MAFTHSLSIKRFDTVECSLCNENIKDNEPVSHLAKGLQSLQEIADRWVKINKKVCTQAPYTEFQLAAERLHSPCQYISVHKNCRITFRNRLARMEAQSSKLLTSSPTTTYESDEAGATSSNGMRRGSLKSKQTCFVCNLKTNDDNNTYNNGLFTFQ